jgi:polar amino acid transport system ATP-binding protein
VAIARALAMKPKLMLFDEPTSALDPKMTKEVLSVLRDLAKDGQGMVVVTHAMTFARQAAHTVYIFQQGRVLESGPPEQVIDAPREPDTAAFLQAVEE